MVNHRAQPAYYPALTGKADSAVVEAMNHLRSLVHDLQTRTAHVEANYLGRDKAHELYSPGTQRKALQVGGTHPESIHNLRGIAYEPQLPGVPMLQALPNIGQYAQPGVIVWQNNHLWLQTSQAGVNWRQLV